MNKKILVIMVGVPTIVIMVNYWWGYKDHPVTIVIPESYYGYVSLVADQNGQSCTRLWGSSIWHCDEKGIVKIKDLDEWRNTWHSYAVEYPSGKTIPNAAYLPHSPESSFKRNQNLYFFHKPTSLAPDGKYFFIGTVEDAVRKGFYFYKNP